MAHGSRRRRFGTSQLAVLRRLRRDGISNAYEAAHRVRRYKYDGFGLVYVVGRVEQVVQDAFDAGLMDRPTYEAHLQVKVGHTKDFDARQRAYKRCYPTYHHIWYSTYLCSERMLLERACHLSLRHTGALTRGVRCNCGKLHQEFYDFNKVGGYAGVEAVVEKWLRVMGERIDRSVAPALGEDGSAAGAPMFKLNKTLFTGHIGTI
ncbi:hypothetical protein B0H19DRAFT_1317512 [Mycena capillaripes]|nr:hypothetical protein B0H19DRAFT_1317512 [Mycena capillaripes]